MPASESSSTPQRKSSRAKKPVKYSLEEEVKTAATKRRHDELLADSSSKKARPEEEVGPTVVKTEGETVDSCVLCERLIIRPGRLYTSLRFHYAKEHYFPEGAFRAFYSEGARSCPFQPCTKRLMKKDEELALHVATQHQKLKEVMEKDGREGVAVVLAMLYPREEVMVARVKQEKLTEEETVDGPVESNEAIEKFLSTASTEPAKATPKRVTNPKKDAIQKTPATAVPVQGALKEAEAKPKKAATKTVPARDVVKEVEVKAKRTVMQKSPAVPARAAVPAEKEEAKCEVKPMRSRISHLHSCLVCDLKEGRRMTTMELSYHYSVCLYNKGWYAGIVSPGEHNEDEDGSALDETGRRWKYQCPVLECEKHKQGRTKPVGFKEFAIHAGMAHHQVERVLASRLEELPALREVIELLAGERREKGEELGELPGLLREEMHTCLLCGGKDKDGSKDGLNMSLKKEKMVAARYHYASCFYDTGAYLALYSPGEQNMDGNGQAKDVMGRDVKYSCDFEQCGQGRAGTVRRKMGYKEFCIHMGSEHGGLEQVMGQDEREEVRKMLQRIKKEPVVAKVKQEKKTVSRMNEAEAVDDPTWVR